MQINGEWQVGEDGVARPVIGGEILAANGSWVPAPFLVDTGADRTVFSAAILADVRLQTLPPTEQLGGVGGKVNSVVVETQIRLYRETGGAVMFRGQYAAVTDVATLDICVLGRDITGLFAVLVDQPGDVVCLLGQRHHYKIEQA